MPKVWTDDTALMEGMTDNLFEALYKMPKYFLRIDDIAHSLGTSLRCKCHTAFLNILDTFHNIQRKGINSKRRQRNIDPFSFEFVDQEVYKLL